MFTRASFRSKFKLNGLELGEIVLREDGVRPGKETFDLVHGNAVLQALAPIPAVPLKAQLQAIVDCVQARAKFWDERLNAAYKDLMKRIRPDQRQALLAAQQLWIQYRDANCAFYYTGDGTIRQVQAAECLRSMTQDRAQELEKAMKLGD